MKFKAYEWDDVNIAHIARHGVIPQEVEEACYNEPLIMRIRKNKYAVYGRSDSGRYLFNVIIYRGKNILRVMTARAMTESERRLYNKKKG